MSATMRIAGLVAAGSAIAAAALWWAGSPAPSRAEQQEPTSTRTTRPRVTSTPTPRLTATPTRTPSLRVADTPTRTPATRTTATARPPAPTATPVPPGIATIGPGDPPLAVPSATNTPLSIGILTPKPTDLPLGVPAATSTAPSFTFGEVPDLLATAIEVTQGIQNMSNEMPLVEGRLTVARVYVKTQDPDEPVGNVSGAMAAFRNGNYLGVTYPENGPIAAVPGGGARTNIDDSLWFYVPQSWTSGNVTFRAFVYSATPDAPFEEEPDAANNEIEVTVEFQDGDPLSIRLAPVHLHVGSDADNPDVTYHYDDHANDALPIILHVLRLHPLSLNELQWDASSLLVIDNPEGPDVGVTSIKPIGHQDGVEWDLTVSDDRHAVNERVAFFKNMAPEQYQGWRWYGMVDPSVSMGGFIGWASNGGTHGLMDNSTTKAIWNNRGGYALAHEIAHLLLSAPEHVGCSGGESNPDPDYPYPDPNCQLAGIDPDGYYGFDPYWQLYGLPGPAVISNDPGAAANQFAFPMMGSLSPWWIDPFYYCRLLDEYGIACDPLALNVAVGPLEPGPRATRVRALPTGDAAMPRARGALPASALVRQIEHDGHVYVSAIVDADGSAGRLMNVMRMIDPAPSAIEASRIMLDTGVASGFVLSFEDAAGMQLEAHALPQQEPGSHDALEDGPTFAGIVAYPSDTAFVRLRSGEVVLDERAVSAAAPTVRLIAPNGGESVADSMDVRWEASDADGDALTFTVMYSADDGATWTPIATDLTNPTVTLASVADIAGGQLGRVRVIASDGILSGFDDSDAPFRVADSPPRPYIIGPADGVEFAQGATVALRGVAQDREDETMPAESLRWRSSLDGELGSGFEARTGELQRGNHVIELTASDSAGNTATATIEITIGKPRPNQPSADDRERAATLLLEGPDKGGGLPWLTVGFVAAVAVAGGMFGLLRFRRGRPAS